MKKRRSAHTLCMRLTCVLCFLLLIFSGVCGGVYALSGFNLLLFLCLRSDVIYRSFLAVTGIAALFSVYSLLVFKPFRGLK